MSCLLQQFSIGRPIREEIAHLGVEIVDGERVSKVDQFAIPVDINCNMRFLHGQPRRRERRSLSIWSETFHLINFCNRRCWKATLPSFCCFILGWQSFRLIGNIPKCSGFIYCSQTPPHHLTFSLHPQRWAIDYVRHRRQSVAWHSVDNVSKKF